MVLLAGAGVTGYFAVKPRTTPPPPPGLAFSPAVQEFGTVGQGAKLEAVFTLTNHYPGPIEIVDVQTGCSCRTASVSQKSLSPGEAATMTLTWSIGTRRGEASETVWVIHTTPDESKHVWARVHLGAVVEPDIVFTPRPVTFRSGEAGVVRVRLTPGRMPTFTASDPYGNTRLLAARYLPQTTEVEVRYTPSGERDDHPGLEVLVKTSSPNEPLLRIPVTISSPTP